MASARRGATESTVSMSGRFDWSTATVLVTVIDSMPQSPSRSMASPTSTPWVAPASTRPAPAWCSVRAVSTRVPPVETSSSKTMASLPATSPTTWPWRTSVSLTRRLSMMASGTPSLDAKRPARFAPPASLATTTGFAKSYSLAMCSATMGMAVR